MVDVTRVPSLVDSLSALTSMVAMLAIRTRDETVEVMCARLRVELARLGASAPSADIVELAKTPLPGDET